MNRILELREKRAKAWDAAKKFLDAKTGPDGLVSAEDSATYDKMEADVLALGKEVERLERQAAIDAALNAPANQPITEKPGEKKKAKAGRASAEYAAAFWQAIRSKSVPHEVFNALETGTDSEGGYLVPDEYQRTLIDALQEQNIQYFDDVEGDVLYPDPELTFKTKLADLPLIVQEMIFSNKIDDNGVLIRTANDKPGYFAVGFMSEKANGTCRYVWLFQVRAKPVTETYATKEGTSITRQTGEVEWTAIKRTSDGRYQAVADEGENGFTAEKAAAFLNTVYTPVFTAVGS